MAIFLRQSHLVKPPRWGSPADVQYAIRVNSEKIYGCDPDNDVLTMPLFWGLPPLDYSGYNNHGTNHGTTYQNGSLDFDGGDDYVGIDASQSLIDLPATHNFTISYWFNADVASDLKVLGGWEGVDDLAIYPNNPGTRIYWRDLGGNIIVEGGADLSGTLYHFTFVSRASDNHEAYRNAVSVGTSFASGDTGPFNSTRIGAFMVGVYEFDGIIDEVRISNVARTADQIALFHDNPYGLYQKVSRVVYSIPAAPSTFVPQIMIF